MDTFGCQEPRFLVRFEPAKPILLHLTTVSPHVLKRRYSAFLLPDIMRSMPAAKKPVQAVVKTRGRAKKPLAKSSGAKPHELPDVVPLPFKLVETEIPGVFLNQRGYRVDKFGIFIPIRRLQEIDQTRAEEVIGEPVTSPAQLLKRVALDPTLPLHQRIAAAVSAAPYFDRKMPIALEGSNPNEPIKTQSSVTLKNLNMLSPEERKSALALFEKLGMLGG